ncbi:hypothetical protein [Ferruginibacter sp. SUN106]|uniref:hypothetical protein n=1 Tax=Ferruginibacter sp. SUN106 TaxID=2978348 RepID=UPI003D3695FD
MPAYTLYNKRFRHLLLNLLFIFQCYALAAQDTSKVAKFYEQDVLLSSLDSMLREVPNSIFLSLGAGFDDSTFVFINDTCIYQNYLKSNESIDHTGVMFPIYFSDSNATLKLTIRFKKSGVVIEDYIDKKFKLLLVNYYRQWQLVYTNHLPMLE